MKLEAPLGSTARRAEAVARRLGPLAAALFVAAPVLAMSGLVSPLVAFQMLGPALLCAVVALLAAVVLLVRGPRHRAWMPLLTAGLPLVVVGAIVGQSAGLPVINDVSTDTVDPPAFDAARRLAGLDGVDLAWPAEFSAIVRAGYPELGSLVTERPRAEVMTAAEKAARAMGLDVHHVDWEGGRIEAVATSRLFRFQDDVVVRVGEAPGGKVAVDVRSRSRVGKGDLGANAKRIAGFLSALRAELGL
ncbi:MAG: DUF1499 domain-containing protein [Myxococcota bacterium]